jgi:hypothetical protein
MAEAAVVEPFVLEVGGARLVAAPVERVTVEQDGWITAKLERAGLADPVMQTLLPPARQEEVRLRILESGQIAGLLAGFLVAEGQPWSAEAARRHQALLARGAADVDHRLLFAMVEGLVQGFFAHGSASVSPIGKPSSVVTDGALSPASSAASAAATGSPSFAPSPATTLTPSAVS